jgi:hypothetical protein
MNTTFNIDINKIKVYSSDTATNIVKEFYITITATKDNVSFNSFFPVTLNETDTTNFIDYQDLTKEQLIDWAIGVIGADTINSIKEGLSGRIQELEQQPKQIVLNEIDLPWTLEAK